jgi:hypothetical protein
MMLLRREPAGSKIYRRTTVFSLVFAVRCGANCSGSRLAAIMKPSSCQTRRAAPNENPFADLLLRAA